jgi:hypothetical protein
LNFFKTKIIQQMRFFVFSRPVAALHFCTVKRRLFNRLTLTLMQKYIILTLAILISTLSLRAQGWERIYGGGGSDPINSIDRTKDGGYVLAGSYGSDHLYLLKVDADGNQQWTKILASTGGAIQGNSVVATQDGGYAVAGYIINGGQRDFYLFKADASGNELWSKSYGISQVGYDEEASSITELPDHSLVMTGYQNTPADPKGNLILLKTDAVGKQIFFKSVGAAQTSKEIGHSICQASNGDLIVAGEVLKSLTAPEKKDVYIVRFNSLGDTLWTKQYDHSQGFDDAGYSIVRGPAGTYIIGGYTFDLPSALQLGLLMKIDETGSVVWERQIPKAAQITGVAIALNNGDILATGYTEINQGDVYILRTGQNSNDIICDAHAGKGGYDGGNGIVASTDGGAAVGGESFPFQNNILEDRAYMVKVDKNCVLFTSYLQGYVFQDNNLNCLPDAGEPALRNWIVGIFSQFDTTYVVANSDGRFSIAVDTGSHTVQLYVPNNYWKPCTPLTTVVVPSFYDTVAVNLPIHSDFSCPRNEVDIATPILRQCSDNVYTVRYCNSGTIPSVNTKIKVTLQPDFNMVGASIPYTILSPDTVLFDIGTVQNGDCDKFTFTLHLGCNLPYNATHCVSAHIYPDDFCEPGSWNGCKVRARATCDGDSVRMYLKNIGNGPTGPIGYVISEDVLMLVAPSTSLFAPSLDVQGAEEQVWAHYATGKTYRITAQQCPDYPGGSIPTAAVEGCLSISSQDTVTHGYYTMFPEDDKDPFISTDCQEIQSPTYNPTYLKRGHPKGYDTPHYIDSKTDLTYLIHFNYTGADTAKQVIVRDTLDSDLDPATVYPGASSHPYAFQVYGSGIVEFTLPNANLIAGSSAAEGFVNFHVSQKPNLPCGTVILNSAAIYYDFNAPEITNQTKHTSCADSIFLQFITATHNIEMPNAEVNVYPNPFEQSTNFEIINVPARDYGLFLYDTQGRLLFISFYSAPTFRLFRNQIPAGPVFYRLTADGKPVATGKLIAK